MENPSSQTVWHTPNAQSNPNPNSTQTPPPPPPPPKKKVMVPGISLPLVAVVVLLIIGAVVLYFNRERVMGLLGRAPSPTPAAETQPIPTSTPDTPEFAQQRECTLEAKICPDGTTVGRSGPNCEFAPCLSSSPIASAETQKTLQGRGFTLRYPDTYTINEEPAGTFILTRVGPTQTLGTELYDGVALIIRWHELQGRTLENFVDQQIAAAGLDGISVIARGKQPITVSEYDGFSYVLDGLGTYTKNFIMKDSANRALQLEYLVEDPTNIGFQQQVNQILSSVNIE